MIIPGVKVLVGVFLMVNGLVPLVAIAKDPSSRQEPVLSLVFSLALGNFSFGFLICIIGALDVIFSEGPPLLLCVSFQYPAMGCILTFKTATLFLALDQFVAVVHSLHYYVIMEARIRRIIVVTWSWIPIMMLCGFVCYQLGLETNQEFDKRTLGTETIVKECHWLKAAFLATMVCEVGHLLMALCSAALFVYTATKGLQREHHANRHDQVDQTNFFFLRFKSFKRIVKVILTLLILDIFGTAARISLRWRPQLALNQVINMFRMLFMVVETWMCGVYYPRVCKAIMNLFRSRSVMVSAQNPIPRRPENLAEWPERAIEDTLQF